MNTDSEEVRELRAEIVRLRYANLELSTDLRRAEKARIATEQELGRMTKERLALNNKYQKLRRAIADLLV